MDDFEDTPDCEESDEALSSSQDKRQGVVLMSLGMCLVRSSLAGDSLCSRFSRHSTRRYDYREDEYLLNPN